MGLPILVPYFILNLLVKFNQHQLGHAFGVLAHPIRRDVLAPVSTIADLLKPFSIFAPALTKRTRVLEEAGLLSRKKQGREHRCRLEQKRIRGAEAWIETHREFWNQRLDAEGRYLKENPDMITAKETQTGSDREILITRLIDAPPERVWRAWADPKEIVRWWGPYGFKTDTDRREFKAGGMWKHTMIGPDGARYPNAAKYEEIVEGERIVYTNGGGRAGGDKGVHFRAVVTFAAKGDKTELTMRSAFDTPAERDLVVREYDAVEGGKQTLSRLAAHIAGDFLVSRQVDAPREKVWRCWTEPERLADWFGPKGFQTIAAKLDFRPGGVYHYCMRGNGVEMWGKWTFKEIDAPRKLVFISAFSDKDGGLGRHPLAPTWPAQATTAVLFTDFGPKTLITVQWSPFEANEVERKTFSEGMASMNQGWSGTFERLDAYLKENR